MNKPAMKAIRKQAQGGFTLIELIVVIVILGILAATALPKFSGLGGDARAATLTAAKGALASVSSMVHGQALINPSAATVTAESTTITISNGYPAGLATTADAAGITTNDYQITANSTTSATTAVSTTGSQMPIIPASGFVVVPKSIASTPAALTCYLSYTPATVSTATPPVITPPVIATVTSACQ